MNSFSIEIIIIKKRFFKITYTWYIFDIYLQRMRCNIFKINTNVTYTKAVRSLTKFLLLDNESSVTMSCSFLCAGDCCNMRFHN